MKYQVIKHVKFKEFNRYFEEWKTEYGSRLKEEMEILQDEISDFNRTTAQHGERGSNIDDDVFEYAGENHMFFRLDENKNSESQAQFYTRRSDAHSDINSKGENLGLENDPNARYSKDDTIFDFADEQALWDEYGLFETDGEEDSRENRIDVDKYHRYKKGAGSKLNLMSKSQPPVFIS